MGKQKARFLVWFWAIYVFIFINCKTIKNNQNAYEYTVARVTEKIVVIFCLAFVLANKIANCDFFVPRLVNARSTETEINS